MRKNGGFKVQRGVRDTFFFFLHKSMTTNNSKAQKRIYLPFFFFLIFLLPELFHEKRAEKSREAQLQSALFSLFSKRPLQLSLSLSLNPCVFLPLVADITDPANKERKEQRTRGTPIYLLFD